MELAASPTPKKKLKVSPEVEYDFFKALRFLEDGHKIARKEWGKGVYGVMKEGVIGGVAGKFTQLRKVDKKYYAWPISDGDIAAKDWRVL